MNGRARLGLGLSVVGALIIIAISTRMLGSRYPDVREEATLAILLGAVVVGGAVWILVRANRAHRAR